MHTNTAPTATLPTDTVERRRHLILAAEDIITIEAWRDPVVEQHPDSRPTNSDETLVWWTPVLGPTCTLMAHRFAALAVDDQRHSFTAHELARTFGLGEASGRLRASLARLHRFGIAQVHGDDVAIRLALPPLAARQLRVLPGYLAVAYRQRP